MKGGLENYRTRRAGAAQQGGVSSVVARAPGVIERANAVNAQQQEPDVSRRPRERSSLDGACHLLRCGAFTTRRSVKTSLRLSP